MAKIKKNHDQNNENHCQAKCFQHMSPVNVLITAVVFRFAIPSEIFWTLVLIYVIYILYVPKSTFNNSENEAENENEEKIRKRKTSFEEIKSVRRILQIYRFVSSKPAIFRSSSNRSTITRNNSSTMLMDSPSLPASSNHDNATSVDSARNSFSSGSATGSTLTTSTTEISDDQESDKFRSPKPRWYSSLICRNQRQSSLLNQQISGRSRRRHYSADINSNYIINGSGSNEVDNQDERTQLIADKPKTSKFAYQNVVNVVLIKGSHLCADNQDYYVKFRLGKEKHKSKIVSSSVQHPFWGESFDLYLYLDQPKLLEIHFCSLNREFSEKTAIDLDSLPQDQTHRLCERFSGDPSDRGSVELLVTVTGGGGGSSSEESECSSIDSGYYEDISRQYETFNNWPNFSDTGHLIVKVHEAENLADSNKINAFCVLQLVNDKIRTQTEYKTNCPKWDKIFNFKFSDINSILEILIFNEESKSQNKFLGKIVVPLSQIQNNEKRWFDLRDKKLQHFMGGRILLEFGMAFNTLKAGIRIIFTPQEQNILLEPKIKFRNAQLVRSAARLKSIYKVIQRWGHFIASCIDWECPIRSVVGFIYSYVFLYYFQWWMIPAWLLAIMAKNYIRLTLGPYWKEQQQNYSRNHNNNFDSDPQEDLNSQIEQFKDDDTKQLVHAESSSSSQSLREKLQSYQEISFFFIKILLENMSILEKFENIGNFTVPFLSWVGVAVLVLILTVGLRFFLLFLLVNEFTKAFRGLNERRNCEPLNILLRAPDFDEMLMYHVNQ